MNCFRRGERGRLFAFDAIGRVRRILVRPILLCLAANCWVDTLLLFAQTPSPQPPKFQSVFARNQGSFLVQPQPPHGSPPTTLVLPRQGSAGSIKTIHGLTMTVDASWSPKSPYTPVRITFQRTGVSTTNTEVKLHFHSERRYSQRPQSDLDLEPGFHVWQQIEIPAAEMQAQTMVSVPHFHGSHQLSWEVLVDGAKADELGQKNYDGYQHGWGSRQYDDFGYNPDDCPNLMIVESPESKETIVDLALSKYVARNDYDRGQERIDQVLLRASLNGWQGSTVVESSILQIPLPNLPTRLIDYSNIDVLYLTLAQFQQLVKQPPAWQAIHRWIASGGNLWVVGVGDYWEQLPEIERAFGMANEPEDPLGRGWRELTVDEASEISMKAFSSLCNKEYGKLRNDLDNAKYAAANSGAGNAPLITPPPPPMPVVVPAMLRRSFMLGQIRAFADERPFGEKDVYNKPNWSHMHRFPISAMSSGEPLEDWQQRHGLWLDDSNEGFWNWLVPGVGLAPVTMFQVLISLFVVCIGPVNYFLLRRVKRLYFLIITVPLAAALITVGLFAYAFITDGLATRVRTRSYTEIDQTTGLTVAWARHSYYSGVEYTDGMRFPLDSVVLPVEPANPNQDYTDRSWRFFEYHLGEEQVLRGDWLPARVPTQYLTISSRQTPWHLQVVTEQGSLRVTNELQTQIKQLFVADEGGKSYWSDGVGVGESKSLSEIDLHLAINSLAETLRQHAPEFPPGWANSRSHSGGWFWSSRYSHSSKEWMDKSILELALKRVEEGELTAPNSLYAPGRYIAIVERSPAALHGLKEAVDQESLHVITGRWK